MEYSELRDVFKYKIFQNLEITGKYNSPVIKAVNFIPKKLISFNRAKACKNPKDYYVHFYIDDYQFERIWQKPNKYIKLLKKFAGVIGPDFSAYTDISYSHRIWNVYRNKVLMAYWQKLGLNVIPNARWIDNCTLDFNNGLDGLPAFSTLAITTNSTNSKIQYSIFQKELKTIISKLKPINLVVYGTLKNDEKKLCQDKKINVYEFKSQLEYCKELKHGKR